MHILVVDDNHDIVELLKTLLESGGYEVTVAMGGKECLDLILKDDFDAILLDITMPEVSGFDVIQSLKDSGHLDQQKIILFTAATISDSEIEKWKETGVKACLRKPFDPSSLFQTISDVSIQE